MRKAAFRKVHKTKMDKKGLGVEWDEFCSVGEKVKDGGSSLT